MNNSLQFMDGDKTPRSSYSDEALMTLLAHGEETALIELVQRYQNEVFRFCYHYLRDIEMAKDAVQEVFLRLYIARDRYNSEKRLKPWLLCIARNLCLNELKRQKLIHFETFDSYIENQNYEQSEPTKQGFENQKSLTPFEKLVIEERQKILWDELNKLPEDAREVIVLRYFEKMHARDIAEILDTTEGAVRTKLHRILKYLKDRLDERKDFDE
ncbi:MAG TPA: sigma-70 family RNA polymerase sigma factor [Candidatus Hydrogenedens sp.]|nr:sigma-70 family RNA polymerase sigma factor [Candidatus Hydrogenedens sp.]HOK08809.1 sigma-70 family RNA polymerase sigma factor [Candidatus Hydrogenedens sp.]HOL18705.1 sigma-70 family RNA polymerase sigma factor [Candidatus Hydrogenedens sp.]HPP58498.1 sigma-70 family RNA polymerase sigma factor [Candidatus Hydrogenedens sp.]